MTERGEIEQVLANWIAQVTGPPGQLGANIDPAAWISHQFLNWWHPRIEDALTDAERAVSGVRAELNRLGGWGNVQLAEALHELIHASDALADLRARLGLVEDLQRGT